MLAINNSFLQRSVLGVEDPGVGDIDQRRHDQEDGDEEGYKASLVRRKLFHGIIDYSHKR